MATRTTNYGLYKPEPTDPTEDFLTEFGYNMDEIDSHLGGGGGGGDSVTWTQIQQSGIKIAEIEINGAITDVYAPQGAPPFTALIIITADTGSTITATKGADTYTATEVTTGQYEVTVDSIGTWTISDGTLSDTVTVTAQTTYYVTLSAVPDGRTVLPTDDIQIWLNCADIWDKTYTTLAEVLADTTTLLALINSPNAVDYMVRSKTWAGVPLVPVMTSNNTPSGVCTVWQYFQGDAYLVFDGDDTTFSRCAQIPSGSGFGYQFATAQRVAKIKGTAMHNAATGAVRTEKIQYSDDGVTWNDSDTFTINENNGTPVTQSEYAIPFSQTVSEVNAHEYWRIYLTNASAVTRNGFWTIQFYSENLCDNPTAMSYIGLNNYCANTLLADSTWLNAICNSTYFESVLNVKVPTMTSNTTPEGECSATLQASPAHLAFDDNTSTRWQASGEATVTADQSVTYKFESPMTLCMVEFFNGSEYFGNYWKCSSTTLKIQISTDGVSYTDVQTVSELDVGISYKIPISPTYGEYFRGQVVGTNTRYGTTAYYTCSISELQFYGRKDI